jgi:hypothetical protein
MKRRLFLGVMSPLFVGVPTLAKLSKPKADARRFHVAYVYDAERKALGRRMRGQAEDALRAKIRAGNWRLLEPMKFIAERRYDLEHGKDYIYARVDAIVEG